MKAVVNIIRGATLLVILSWGIAHPGWTQEIAQTSYRIDQLLLRVETPSITIPRGIESYVPLAGFGGEGTISGVLSGPSFDSSLVVTAFSNRIELPLFSTSGIHFLENIRLELPDGTVIPAEPSTVTINVLDELLVSEVTSRPLSLEEIENLGIEFDESSFQAFSFTIAFTTESEVINFDFPVFAPIQPVQPDGTMVAPQIPSLNLSELEGLNLPNLTIEPVMLEVIEDDLPEGVEIPPIPGIVVIPGNVAFLNQFFSVLLSVSNQAPDGTPLVVTDLTAEIMLPPGGDQLVGDITSDPPYAPGDPEFDNPLRIARTTEGGRQNIVPIISAGEDGEFGTSDDVDALAPQRDGNAEFLVEGVREGAHIVDMEIKGVLQGLPNGPVEVMGFAQGAVVVRDPTFSLTFIHPDTVRAGEIYELVAHIENTSQTDANLVTVSLDGPNLTGARLIDGGDGSQTVDTIAAGDSATLVFTLEALRTGQVTASSLRITGEAGDLVTGRRLSLASGVSEDGVPLSPDTLLLPPAVGELRERSGNQDLTFRALALLGQAHSIATAPAGSLPAGVERITPLLVNTRAQQLTEAAIRWELSRIPGADGNPEELPEGLLLTLQDFYYDWLGAGLDDSGWDSLYRRSRQARLLGVAFADVFAREAETLGLPDLLGLQASFADTESYRDGHVTVLAQDVSGSLPVYLSMTDGGGNSLGGSLDPEGGVRDIPNADVLTFADETNIDGQMATVLAAGGTYTGEFIAVADGSFDAGFVVPDETGELVQVMFAGLSVTAGEQVEFIVTPGLDPLVTLIQGSVEIAPSGTLVVPDGPPEILGVIQDVERGDQYGRVVAVLFDEEVDTDSAQASINYQISNAIIPVIPPPDVDDGNLVGGVRLQIGDRIALLRLRDPVGPFVDRSISISEVADLEGRVMDPYASVLLAAPDIEPGGQLTGRVIRADGAPVAEAVIQYFQNQPNSFTGLCEDVLISTKNADDNGRYSLDYVKKDNCNNSFTIVATDLETGEQGTIRTRVSRDGQRISLDVVLVGRGTVEGTVRDASGNPIPNAVVNVTSGTDMSGYGTRTDQNGFYQIPRVVVGPVGVEASSPDGLSRAAGVIEQGGDTALVDLTIFAPALGAIIGEVRFPDETPVAGIEVFLELQESVTGRVFLDAALTDEAGTFRFDEVPVGSYRVRALDQAAGLIGDALTTITEDDTANNPAFALVVLGGLGSVSGTIFESDGITNVPVPGAIVSGGLELVTADEQGRYTIPEVPVGVRTIQAVNPDTGSIGSRSVTVLTAGQISAGIDILLAPLATITGRVLDGAGAAVANQEVILIVDEVPGFGPYPRRFFVRRTETAADGTYSFDRLEPKTYTLTAERGIEIANGTAQLSANRLSQVVDLRFQAPTGSVAGQVLDEQGFPVAAQVSLRARAPNAAGVLELRDLATVVSDPDAGFAFDGLFLGPYTLVASSFFAAADAVASGELTANEPAAENIVLQFIDNTGSLAGCVLDPEGNPIQPVVDPASGLPVPLEVFITSRLLRDQLARDTQNPTPDGIRVDASGGCFQSSIPLPPDYYQVDVTDTRADSPTFGLRARANASVRQGAETIVDPRLLGLGAVAVEVVDGQGVAIPGVSVSAQRSSFPFDIREADVIEPTDVTPLILDNLTEGPISLSAVVSTDPNVDVGDRDELRGFGGSTSGTVIRGSTEMITIVIASAGSVSGLFLRVDGVTPVPNAQVEIRGGAAAFVQTDVDGRFSFDGVAVGGFSLHGFDPFTGRSASSTGALSDDGQSVVQNLVLGPLGTVQGVVLSTDRAAPIAGADVFLNVVGGQRRVTADVDGSFIFPSVPGGDFSVLAVADTGLSGRQEGTLTFEGEVVDVEVLLDGSGVVEGTVFQADGSPAPAAEVTLRDAGGRARVVQAGSLPDNLPGVFSFADVPLGPFTLSARPLGALTPGEGGEANGVVSFNNEIVLADVTYQGTITVGVQVQGESGTAPVIVTLDSSGPFGGRAQPTTVEPDGTSVFDGIPRTAFVASASQVTPSNVTISASAAVSEAELPAAGGRLSPDVVLTLSPVATLAGQIVDAVGNAVQSAAVNARVGGTSLLVLTDAQGEFEFLGVPLSQSVRIDVDAAENGAAVFLGSIDADGNLLDGGGLLIADLVIPLDVDDPEVTAVAPVDGQTDVGQNVAVVVEFSEPMDIATLSTCEAIGAGGERTIQLLAAVDVADANDPADPCDDANVVLTDIVVSPDSQMVTLTPLQPLAGRTQHTIVVRGEQFDMAGNSVGGARDLVGKPVRADFVARFVTRDDIAPEVINVTPVDGARDVAADALIRIGFNEIIDPASVTPSTVVVTGPAGDLAGTRTLVLGGTAVVFTQSEPLADNATYTISVDGVTDTSGNGLAAPFAASFATLDTIAPSIDAIIVPAGGRPGETITVEAQVSAPDVDAVEFLVDGVVVAVAANESAPGVYLGTFEMPAMSVQVSARAVDLSGNVGPTAASVPVPVVVDLPPETSITSPAPGAVVLSNNSLDVSINATDDVAVTEIRLTAAGIIGFEETRDFGSGSASLNTLFTVPLPESANGALALTATATDSAGQSVSSGISVDITIDRPPEVTLTAPADGVEFVEGSEILASATASDDVGVTQVEFTIDGQSVVDTEAPYTATGTLGTCPAGRSAQITARATDTRGQVSILDTVSVTCTDDLDPEITLTAPVEGADFASGTVVDLTADASDDVDVVSVTFEIQGETYVDDTAPYSAQHTLAACPGGAAVVVSARAEDTFGQVSTDNVTINCTSLLTRGRPLLAIDFEGSSLSVTGDGYESFTRPNLPSATYTTSEGDITVGFTGLTTALEGWHALDRNLLVDGGGLTIADVYDDAFYEDVVTGSGADAHYQVTLSGLVPDRTYVVTFYSWDAPTDARFHPQMTTQFAPLGDTVGNPVSVTFTQGVLPVDDDSHAGVGFFSSPTGTLTFDVSATGSGGNSDSWVTAPLNGLEVALAETGGDLAPSVRITEPAEFGTIRERESFTVVALANDDVGIAEVTFEVDGVQSVDDTFPYELTTSVVDCPVGNALVISATARDTSGNETTDTITVNCAASGSAASLLAIDFEGSSLSVTEDGYDSFARPNLPSTTYTTSEGDITVGFTGLTTALEGWHALDRNLVVDGGALTIADVYDDAFYEDVVTGSGADAHYEVTLSGLVPDRTYAVTFYSWDDPQDARFHPQMTTQFAPLGDTAGNPVSVTYTQGVLPVEDTSHAGVGFYSSPTGTLTFEVSATGSGGNTDSWVTAPLNGLEVALAETGGDLAPSVRVTEPVTFDTVREGEPFTVVALANDDVGIAEVTFDVDGVQSVDDTFPYELTTNVTTCPVTNEVLISTTARDTSGNETTDTITVNCVTSAPVVSLLAIDFEGSSLSVTEDGYESFARPSLPSTTYTTSEGDITVGFTGLTTALEGWHALDRNLVVDGDALTIADVYDDAFYEDVVTGSGADAHYEVTLSGLVPDRTYAVTFYSWDDPQDARFHPQMTTQFVPLGDTVGNPVSVTFAQGVLPADDDSYAGVGFFSSPTGTLTFEVSATGSGGNTDGWVTAPLNGLEIASLDGAPPPPPNLVNHLANPGFEQGTSFWTFAGGGASACEQPCVTPNTGSWAAYKNLFDGGAGTITQAVQTQVGETYRVEVNIAQNSFASGTVTVSFGTTVGVSLSASEVTTTYGTYSFEHVATDTVTELQIGGTVTGGTFFFDDLVVEGPPNPIDPNLDTDGDGITDAIENLYGMNPNDPTDAVDTDGDFIPDVAEVFLGTDPLDPSDGFFDSDGDGVANVREFLDGTSALDSTSIPTALTYRIGGFDVARNGEWGMASGSVAANLRSEILSVFPTATFSETNELTAEYLDSVDLIVLTAVRTSGTAISSLTVSEATALREFVEGGGHAILLGDNNGGFEAASDSMLNPFGIDIAGFLGGAQLMRSMDNAHPIMNGPHGIVDTLQTGFSGEFVDLGDHAQALATYDLTHLPGAVVVNANALNSGSGYVLALGDSFLLDVPDADARSFMLNAISLMLNQNGAVQVAADSQTQFTTAQGTANWTYGYRDVNADVEPGYDASEFVPFPVSHISGEVWDWPSGDPPNTSMSATAQQGTNSGGFHHWVVRRLTIDEDALIVATGRISKMLGQITGDGVSARIYRNGSELLEIPLVAADTVGMTFYLSLDVSAGDVLDFVVDPLLDDAGDNTRFLVRTYPRDTRTPAVILTSPTAGTAFLEGESISVVADAVDDQQVSNVQFLIDGSVSASANSVPYEATVVAPSGVSGITLSARAMDLAGNQATSAGVSVGISADNTVGLSEGNPATSCLHIQDAGASAGDGVYWVQAPSGTYQVHCDFTAETGGWTRVGSLDGVGTYCGAGAADLTTDPLQSSGKVPDADAQAFMTSTAGSPHNIMFRVKSDGRFIWHAMESVGDFDTSIRATSASFYCTEWQCDDGSTDFSACGGEGDGCPVTAMGVGGGAKKLYLDSSFSAHTRALHVNGAMCGLPNYTQEPVWVYVR